MLAGLSGGETPARLADRIDALGKLILAHEAAENQLHGQALYDEIGVGD